MEIKVMGPMALWPQRFQHLWIEVKYQRPKRKWCEVIGLLRLKGPELEPCKDHPGTVV